MNVRNVAVKCFAVAAVAVSLTADLHPAKADGLTTQELFQQVKTAEAEKRWDDAKQLLIEVVERNPRAVEAYAELAWIHNELREFDAAIKVCSQALARSKKNPAAFREAGYAMWKKGNLDLAAKALLAAHLQDRTDITTLKYLEGVLRDGGDDENADSVRERRVQLEQERESPRPRPAAGLST